MDNRIKVDIVVEGVDNILIVGIIREKMLV